MKAFSILLLLAGTTASQCSTIDQLKSTAEVEAFVKAHDETVADRETVSFQIRSTEALATELACDGIFKEWDIQNWEKADLNNDGRTDLLLIGEFYGPQPMVVLDLGDAGYKFEKLKTSTFEPCELFKPFDHQGQTLIKAYYKSRNPRKAMTGAANFEIDTLTYFKNTLVKYNPAPRELAIRSIILETTPCFGMCPEFIFEITPDDRVNFDGKNHTPVRGKSKFSAQAGSFKEMSELLNYIDVASLNNYYEVGWTDDQTGTLTVVFEDGSNKQIRDYGMQGTPGLKAIYQRIKRMVFNMNSM